VRYARCTTTAWGAGKARIQRPKSRCVSSQDQDVAGLCADALARRRKRSQDQLTPALMPLLRGSEPGDDLEGFPRTIELNEPRAPIGKLGFTEG
jgi:hypothetical protein